MLKFFLGFLVGIITEFVFLMVIAYNVKKAREKETLHGTFEKLNEEIDKKTLDKSE